MDEAALDRLLATDEARDERLTAWLAVLPPDAPPDGFAERLEALLGIAPARAARAAAPDRKPRGALRTAAGAATWAVRGPAAALQGGGLGGLRQSLAGLDAARYALGPLGRRTEKAPRRPLWRRVLGV